MEDVVFSALFIIDDKLNRDICAIGPFRVGWSATVSHHVSWIIFVFSHGAQRKPRIPTIDPVFVAVCITGCPS